MPDTRPLQSPMPPELATIWQKLVDELKPMLDAAFDATLTAQGEPARLQNDALSGLATVGGFVMLQLTARLMALKEAEPDLALRIAAGEMRLRATQELIALLERRQAS